jgi:hypothetical protein
MFIIYMYIGKEEEEINLIGFAYSSKKRKNKARRLCAKKKRTCVTHIRKKKHES